MLGIIVWQDVIEQVVTERVVTWYRDIVGFDFHSYGEVGPSRNVAVCFISVEFFECRAPSCPSIHRT